MGDNNYKNRHREQGLCVNCSEKAYPNNRLCLKHIRSRQKTLQEYRDKNRLKINQQINEIKRKRVEDGLCFTCGGPRDRDDRKNCVNCREHLYIERYEHAEKIIY